MDWRKKYDGKRNDCKMHGRGTFIWKDGREYKEEYDNGKAKLALLVWSYTLYFVNVIILGDLLYVERGQRRINADVENQRNQDWDKTSDERSQGKRNTKICLNVGFIIQTFVEKIAFIIF